jgi:hypothetical protein
MHAAIKLNQEEKMSIAKGIVDTLIELMQRTITAKSAKNRAEAWSKSHNQSRKFRAYDTILLKILTGKQHLPGRLRDFRLNLLDEDRSIWESQLSDILLKRLALRLNLIEYQGGNFRFPVGRPKADWFAEENRGRDSYYQPSFVKMKIDQVLNDSATLEYMSNMLLTTESVSDYFAYSWLTVLHQMKENERAFLNSFKPTGVSEQQLKLNFENPGPWIFVKDLTDEKMRLLSAAYAQEIIEQCKKNENNIAVYSLAALLYFGMAYDA